MFPEGRWLQLLINSEACAAASSTPSHRRRRNRRTPPNGRAERAQSLVLLGVGGRSSCAKNAEDSGSSVRPRATANGAVSTVDSRFGAISGLKTRSLWEKARYLENLKCARRGAAAGPSSMICGHVRPVLEISGIQICRAIPLWPKAKFGQDVLPSLAKRRLANTNFDQTKFGHHQRWPKPSLAKTKFGQTNFGQTKSGIDKFGQTGLCTCCARVVAFQLPPTATQSAPTRTAPPPNRTNFAFFPLPPQFSFFLPSLGLLVRDCSRPMCLTPHSRKYAWDFSSNQATWKMKMKSERMKRKMRETVKSAE